MSDGQDSNAAAAAAENEGANREAAKEDNQADSSKAEASPTRTVRVAEPPQSSAGEKDDDGDDKDDDKDDDERRYRPSAKSRMSIRDLMQCDAEDESLRRYKAALLGLTDVPDESQLGDPNDPREVIISSFGVEVVGEQPLIFDLSNEEVLKKLSSQPFSLKESSKYRFRVKFRVQHNLVAGLRWRNRVTKAGITVHSEEEMLGSYAPGQHEWTSQEFTTPSGWLARGSYKGRQKFCDDADTTHLRVPYAFKIVSAK